MLPKYATELSIVAVVSNTVMCNTAVLISVNRAAVMWECRLMMTSVSIWLMTYTCDACREDFSMDGKAESFIQTAFFDLFHTTRILFPSDYFVILLTNEERTVHIHSAVLLASDLAHSYH